MDPGLPSTRMVGIALVGLSSGSSTSGSLWLSSQRGVRINPGSGHVGLSRLGCPAPMTPSMSEFSLLRARIVCDDFTAGRYLEFPHASQILGTPLSGAMWMR